MSEIKDVLNIEEKDLKKLPDMLNVLTILTYIGSGLGVIGLITNYFQDCDKVINDLDDMPEMGGVLDKFMDMSRESVVVFCDNKMLILLVTLIGLVLCVFGAIQMRNLKKTGFMIYAIGELLPPVIMLILAISSFSWLSLTGFIIPIIFVFLYASQRKHLIH